jgi:hypothetical protein
VHCRNARTHDVDENGIGICLVGDLDKEPPTPRQIAAAKALIAHLSTALRHRSSPYDKSYPTAGGDGMVVEGMFDNRSGPAARARRWV